MRVLMLSKACIVGIYQRKLEHIAAHPEIELCVVVPPYWRDERGTTTLERVYTTGYHLEVLPIRRNGDYHLHHYAGLGRVMRDFQPQVVHIDEEPYNLAAWQTLWWAKRIDAAALFFSWQNIARRYPPPFNWGERWVMHNVRHAIAGTQSALNVWREKGYHGPASVIPQFGIDPDLFRPAPDERPPRPFTIGYIGRMVPEKGLCELLAAFARAARPDWHLRLLGGGPMLPELQALAAQHGISEQISFDPLRPSAQVPPYYHGLDLLVLPSLTRPNWKEQFGRVLVEAMASGVPVIGSDSGAIPNVIGEAGVIVPEGDIEALAGVFFRLCADPAERARLAEMGRRRVLAHFTHQQIAAETVQIYINLI